VDIGQAKVPALEPVGQFLVVQAQTMEDGGVEVVDVDGAIDHVITKVIGLP
jgi:hypothetical protein